MSWVAVAIGGAAVVGAGASMYGSAQNSKAMKDAAGNVINATQKTPEEASQYTGSFDLGKVIQQIMQSQQGLGQAPAGYQNAEQQYQNQGPLAQSLYGQALQGVQDPYANYQSALNPQLKAAQDFINSDMQKRGLLSSGLNIENMGRAGVDLAIQDAQNRMTYRQQGIQNASNLGTSASNLQQQNLTNLSNLYSNQQNFGLSASGRQAGAATNAAQMQAYPAQAALGNAYGTQQGIMTAASNLGTGYLQNQQLGDILGKLQSRNVNSLSLGSQSTALNPQTMATNLMAP